VKARILFLGTGGDATVVGKQRRGSGGIILQTEGYQFHLDPGPGALVRAKEYGINLRENTALLVSHAHMNHVNDINAVISAMTYDGLDRKGVVIATDSVINGSIQDDIRPVLTNHAASCVERVINVKAGQRVGIQHVEIHALHTFHTDPNGVGFKFFTPDFVLAYSSDTAYTAELAEHYKGSDILVLNVVYPADSRSKENLNMEDAQKIISKVKPKVAILTHFGNKLLEQDPIYVVREIQKSTGVQIIAAQDGLELHPTSYAAELRQKTLNLYSKGG
jgi:ribonuclease BN (tRNA processing enzyme)